MRWTRNDVGERVHVAKDGARALVANHGRQLWSWAVWLPRSGEARHLAPELDGHATSEAEAKEKAAAALAGGWLEYFRAERSKWFAEEQRINDALDAAGVPAFEPRGEGLLERQLPLLERVKLLVRQRDDARRNTLRAELEYARRT